MGNDFNKIFEGLKRQPPERSTFWGQLKNEAVPDLSTIPRESRHVCRLELEDLEFRSIEDVERDARHKMLEYEEMMTSEIWSLGPFRQDAESPIPHTRISVNQRPYNVLVQMLRELAKACGRSLVERYTLYCSEYAAENLRKESSINHLIATYRPIDICADGPADRYALLNPDDFHYGTSRSETGWRMDLSTNRYIRGYCETDHYYAEYGSRGDLFCSHPERQVVATL